MKNHLGVFTLIFGLLMLSAAPSLAQKNWGVGLRLGDPTGITVKKYFNKSALELNVGRTHLIYGRGYYDRHFDYWYDRKSFGYADYDYINYYGRPNPIGIQLHYLMHRNLGQVIGENIEGLDWYFGFGGQFRTQTYNFAYRYKVEGNPDWIYVDNERVTDIDLGVDGVLGLEYTLPKAPFSIFLETNLFVEVIDNPFAFWGQGGAGVRYNF